MMQSAWHCLQSYDTCISSQPVSAACLLLLPQLGLRTLSVGLANHLLVNLPEPFKRTTFAAAQVVAAAAAQAADELVTSAAAETGSMLATATPAPTRVRGAGRTVPEGMVAAPWSVVALAALLHR